MDIWLIHLGELLPIDGNVRLFRYGILADMLAEESHNVTRWAPTFVHATKQQRATNDKVYEVNKNYSIELLYAKGYEKHISLSRWRFHRKIADLFLKRSKELRGPDVILSAMPTPATCAAAIKYGNMYDVPVVIDIRDLWPDVYLDLLPDPLKDIFRPLLFPFHRKNKRIFSEAAGITAISQSYLDWGLDYVNREQSDRDRVFHMGYRKEEVPDQKKDKLEKKWENRGIKKDAFICCFFGTIAYQYNLDTVIEAARYFLQSEKDIQFVLCGDGQKLGYYQDKAKRLENVFFPGWVTTEEINVLMEWAEIGLAPYKDSARMSLPNKPFEYFSGGLPVVSSLKGELEGILEENECGLTYNAHNKDSLINIISHLYENPQIRNTMGGRSYQIFEEKYSSDVVYPKMISYLENISEVT